MADAKHNGLMDAISRLSPTAFSHPAWVHFGTDSQAQAAGCSSAFQRTIDNLEQQENPLDAGHALLVCAALDNRAGHRRLALDRIERAALLSAQGPEPQLAWWALWAAASVRLQIGDYVQAADSLHRLRAELDAHQEWLLANVVSVMADALLENGRSSQSAPIAATIEPSLEEILARLLHWGEPTLRRGTNSHYPTRPLLPAPPPLQHSVHDTNSRPTLAVYCFGQFRADYDDRPLQRWPSRKPLSIFRYLALSHPAPVAQEVLMDTFWPESDPDAARGSLHQAIYTLRKMFKQELGAVEIIHFEHDSYSLHPHLNFWLDVHEFEQHIRTARRLESAAEVEAAIAEYGVAEGLYQGDLLEEDLYEEWLQWPREQKRQSYLDTADRLAEYYFQRGDWPATIALCHRILEYDHCHERAHTRLMRCYAAQGQRHLAVRQYRACVEALQTELDLAPAPETVELFRQIVGRPQVRSK